MPASGEFRLSITRALADQLITSLADLEPEPLAVDAVEALDPKGGVYQLYLKKSLVYVGKADSSLPRRLLRHHRKLSGRANIELNEVTFCALYVYEDLHAVAPETLLINYYRTQGAAPWNFNGFGNNDPGQNRDQTVFAGDHFDVLYPARLDWPCPSIEAGALTARTLAAALKAALPYIFRFHSAPILDGRLVNVPSGGMTADDLFSLLAVAVKQADPAWNLVALPGYVIMYPKPGPYPSARKIY